MNANDINEHLLALAGVQTAIDELESLGLEMKLTLGDDSQVTLGAYMRAHLKPLSTKVARLYDAYQDAGCGYD